MLAREIPHKGGRTFGYRISDGRSTLAYMPDHCPTALGPGEDGFGEYHPAAIELARGADVLVHDAQLFPEELSSEAGFGHAVADYAVELGRARRLANGACSSTTAMTAPMTPSMASHTGSARPLRRSAWRRRAAVLDL